MCSQLSGGMRKRVGLARAIIQEPEILLYDEPTTGLDPILADSINRLVVHMEQSLRITSVVISHDIESALKYAHGEEVSGVKRFHGGLRPHRQFLAGSSEGPIQVL